MEESQRQSGTDQEHVAISEALVGSRSRIVALRERKFSTVRRHLYQTIFFVRKANMWVNDRGRHVTLLPRKVLGKDQ